MVKNNKLELIKKELERLQVSIDVDPDNGVSVSYDEHGEVNVWDNYAYGKYNVDKFLSALRKTPNVDSVWRIVQPHWLRLSESTTT